MKKLLSTLSALSLLSGCASHLSQQQCLATNWQEVGFKDGTEGQAQRDLSGAIQDCQKFQLAVDTRAYQRGWLAGMQKYCTPSYDLGLTDGRAGNPYSNILQRASRCQSANLSLNTNNYKRGHNTGLQSFCTYENGQNFALQGKDAPDVCTQGLRVNFTRGWQAGAKQFCANIANAFALGKQGQPYPSACTPALHIAFKSEYDRGAAIRSQTEQLQGQINDLDNQIRDRVWRFGLVDTHDYRVYELGENRTPEARAVLHQARTMMSQRQSLQNQLTQLQVTG
jgi:hypothetical protein